MKNHPRVRESEALIEQAIAAADQVTAKTLAIPLLRPWMPYLLGAMALNAIHGVAVALQNLTPKWLISDILKPPELSWHDKMVRLALLAAIYFIVSTFGRMLAWHTGYRLFTHVRERVLFIMRSFFFRRVNHLCLRFHGKHPSGELFNYLFGSPLAQIVHFYQHTSMSVPGAVFTLVATLSLLGMWDPVLTGVLLLTALGNVVVMNQARRRMRELHRDYQAAEGDVAGHAADMLRGNRAVKLYAMEERIAEIFEREATTIGRKSYERDIKAHIQYMKQETVSYVAYSILLIAAGWRYLGGHADEGVIAAYLVAFNGILGPLSSLFTSVTLFGGAQASLDRIGHVLKTASSTPDPRPEKVVDPPREGDIVFRDVTFRYEEEREPALRHINLVIPPGQRIALVGPSGAGKSTIVQLLLRLYDPQEGEVVLGGVDLRKCRGSDVRRNIGIVPQDPFIFRTTVRDNIRVARPDASDSEIIRASERAHAWEFIRDLPRQLDEVVGEGGSTLSGGQRQRLAIARVLLMAPSILVFDEATSALDTVSERLIQQSLENESAGRTAIFIAHRLATVKTCDRILVVDRGFIVQDGAYDELVATEGLFKEMVQGQQLRL
ncbi:MAG TPA: ABC transporter ATP-binding protein [Kiritimatiellia bacterium]|nr:ABC transporter ATP-binding protein [Kiritimatiellia bacterium]HMP97964.1 ABC transporter ATP-binding protein [Kiritimatiellia bacterium]